MEFNKWIDNMKYHSPYGYELELYKDTSEDLDKLTLEDKKFIKMAEAKVDILQVILGDLDAYKSRKSYANSCTLLRRHSHETYQEIDKINVSLELYGPKELLKEAMDCYFHAAYWGDCGDVEKSDEYCRQGDVFLKKFEQSCKDKK